MPPRRKRKVKVAGCSNSYDSSTENEISGMSECTHLESMRKTKTTRPSREAEPPVASASSAT
jgi:hypothetical protein